MHNLKTLMTFSLTDGIILFILLIILGYLFYISFIKHRKEPCHGCPHAKQCKSINKDDFIKKYHECKEKDTKPKCPNCK